MPYLAYILQSETCHRNYCGSTEDLIQRIRQHNDPSYKLTRTTKVFPGPWVLVWSQRFETRKEALAKEMAIKKIGIGRFLERQKRN